MIQTLKGKFPTRVANSSQPLDQIDFDQSFRRGVESKAM